MKIRPTFSFLRFIPGLFLLSSLILGNFTPASAALRCYVKAGAAGTGTSWTSAYGSLQSALANASCTEIWVAAGTYKPTTNTERTISFVLKNGVALYGGFGGTETLVSQRDPSANSTILSGNIGDPGTGSDNSYHVVVGSGTDNTARLDGFTVTAGNADGADPNYYGGGMYSLTGSPTLANLTFTGNQASSQGGGMANSIGSNPILTNVTFSGNLAYTGGGMVNAYGSNPTLTNVTFSANTAGFAAGGIYNFQSSPTLINTTFSGNSASPGGGGGMYNYSNSTTIITNSIFYGNINGEIVNASSTLTVTYSIVQGGFAGTGNLNANPLLKPLGDYGGFTRTMPLGSGSPAIDTGTNTGCPATDQRGVIRPQDGDGNSSAICDMGATEGRFSAGTCYVNAAVVAGFRDGIAWKDAFPDLQSALGASPCTAVWVAKGTYKPTGGTDRTVSFSLKNGVSLFGGFAGTETLLSQRNPAVNPAILSGEIGASGNADNSYHVVVGSGTNGTARLDGFTIQAGNANGGSSPDNSGGGMFNNAGSPTLARLHFRSNSAGLGGGMANQGSSPSLTSVTFSANSALDGGGVWNTSSSPTLVNVTFNGNSAANGGAMSNSSSSPILTNVTISGNTAASGGAIKNTSGSSPVIKNSILYGDTGGEISSSSSTPSVTYTLVQGGYPGTGNINANPLLKPLGNYGGSTKTMLLNFGSPAIDKGSNTGCPLKDQRGITRPLDGDGNAIATCDMGATEAPAIVLVVKSFRSAGALDGWVLESTESSNIGGSMDAAADTLSIGDGTLDRQGRSLLSFDTSSLPENAVITSVTLKIKKEGLVGSDPFTTHGNLLVDVRKGPFSNNAALQLTDFQALASKNAAITILNNPVSGWYSRAMPSVNFGYINKAGPTQFRLRFALDDNDDGGADYLKFYSGNAALASVRPLLIVKYYLP